MFAKVRGWILGGVFSIVGTAIGIQYGLLGPGQGFLQNLLTTAVIWIGARLLSKLLSKY